MIKKIFLLNLLFYLLGVVNCFAQQTPKNDTLNITYPSFQFFDDLEAQNKPRKNIYFKENRWDSLKFIVESAFKKFTATKAENTIFLSADVTLLNYFNSRCSSHNIKNKRSCFHLDSLPATRGFTFYFYLQFYGQYYTDYYESVKKPKVVTKQVQILMKSYLLGFCVVVKDGKIYHTKSIDDIVNEHELKRYEKRELFFNEDRIVKMLQKLFQSFNSEQYLE